MRYTTDERGIMNNYAIEPIVYAATYPSQEEQRQYFIQAVVAALVVFSAVAIAVAVS